MGGYLVSSAVSSFRPAEIDGKSGGVEDAGTSVYVRTHRRETKHTLRLVSWILANDLAIINSHP